MSEENAVEQMSEKDAQKLFKNNKKKDEKIKNNFTEKLKNKLENNIHKLKLTSADYRNNETSLDFVPVEQNNTDTAINDNIEDYISDNNIFINIKFPKNEGHQLKEKQTYLTTVEFRKLKHNPQFVEIQMNLLVESHNDSLNKWYTDMKKISEELELNNKEVEGYDFSNLHIDDDMYGDGNSYLKTNYKEPYYVNGKFTKINRIDDYPQQGGSIKKIRKSHRPRKSRKIHKTKKTKKSKTVRKSHKHRARNM